MTKFILDNSIAYQSHNNISILFIANRLMMVKNIVFITMCLHLTIVYQDMVK